MYSGVLVSTYRIGNTCLHASIGTVAGAARALLGWRQNDLAKASGVGLATVARIEQGKGVVQGNFSTIVKLQQTLERAGIAFLDRHWKRREYWARLFRPDR